MKILLLTWACDAEDISEPGVTYHWVEQLSRHHEVTLLAVSRPDRFGCVEEQFPNLRVFEWQDICVPKAMERFRAVVKPGYFMYFIKARRFLKKLLKSESFDIIHQLTPFAYRYPTPAYGLGTPIVRGPIAGGLPTPVYFKKIMKEDPKIMRLLRSSDYVRKRIDPWLINAYQQTDLVIFAAPYVGEVAQPLSIRNNIVELEHGVDKKKVIAVDRNKKPGEVVEFLYVGRIIRSKGLRHAIEALKCVKSLNPIRFTVIGDGNDRRACELAAQVMPDGISVRFLGWIDKANLEEFYIKSDVFLFPSFREPTGGVLMEAMMYSLPIITCKYGGPEYIVSPDVGVLIRPQSEKNYIAKLTHAIQTLADDMDTREAMSRAAFARASDLFPWDKKIERINQAYKETVKKFFEQ